MSFCPKCKSEYINGRKDCADCGTLLVESLDEVIEESFDEAEVAAMAESIVEELDEAGINISNDNENETDEEQSAPNERVREFVPKKDKYKDYISTGYMFVIVGIAGLIAVILNMLGIINLFKVSGAQAVLFYTVIGGMFIIFTFVGFNSFKNAKRIKIESENEDNFLDELKKFIDETFTTDKFADCDDAESDEETYFNRTEIIKNGILEKFPEINVSLLEQIVDETYDKLF